MSPSEPLIPTRDDIHARFLQWGDITLDTPEYAIIQKYYITNITSYSIVSPYSMHPNSYNKMEHGIGCYTCAKISWNVNDVNNRYCGNCHDYFA